MHRKACGTSKIIVFVYRNLNQINPKKEMLVKEA